MKASLVRVALVVLSATGCNLSPGQDLPSAGSKDTDGGSPVPDFPTIDSPGGDGDITIGLPPEAEDPCGLGGAAGQTEAGGLGGSCPQATEED